MKRTIKAKIVDVLLIIGMILPFVGCWILKALFTPASEGINVTGPIIYWSREFGSSSFTTFYITESTVVSAAVVVSIFFLCIFLTRGIRLIPDSKRQVIAEWIVEQCTKFTTGNMGAMFVGLSPFMGAIMVLSALSSLASLIGLYSPTSDINIVAGWSIVVFILITHYKMKGGVLNYLKSFGDPIPVFYPFNVISEFATPVSMTFRHYGNILSGAVVSTLIASGLAGMSRMLLSLISKSTWITSVAFLRVGLPAVLSLYFDVFSAILQAFIFAMLTALYIANGYPEEAANRRREKKLKNKK